MKKWERVRKTIATAAPALGRALSLPGSELVGNMIGAALGVPATPEAIESHIVANPADIAKIASPFWIARTRRVVKERPSRSACANGWPWV